MPKSSHSCRIFKRPPDQPVPDAPGGIEQFLALLSSNLAGAVNPKFSEPTTKAIEANQTARDKIKEENRQSHRDFDKSRMERGFAVASQMAMESLKAASDAGDTKAATESALHLARINDALERRRQQEKAQNEKDLQIIKDRGKKEGVDIDPDLIENYANDLHEGTVAETLIPMKLRPFIRDLMRQRGWKVTPKPVRDAINEVSASQNVVAEIKAISEQINTAKSGLISRGLLGVKHLKDSIDQEGLAADLEIARGALSGNLARAVAAERGVLTEQDRRWAMKMVPDIWTAAPLAQRQIAMLERAIAAKILAAQNAYMTPGGKGKADVPSLEFLSREKSKPSGAASDSTDYDAPAIDDADDPLGVGIE